MDCAIELPTATVAPLFVLYNFAYLDLGRLGSGGMPIVVKNDLYISTGTLFQISRLTWDVGIYNSCDTLDVVLSVYVVMICSWMDMSPGGVLKNPSLVIL